MHGRQSGQEASMVVSALMLFALLLALGLGLMSSQSARMKAARAQVEALQAKGLALSAWADAKTKLGKDLFFPPVTGEQNHFSYSEDVYNQDEAGQPVFYGTYSVVIDTRYIRSQRDQGLTLGTDSLVNVPVGFYLITCTGKVGERGAPPRSERTLRIELDAQTFRVIRLHDLSSL